MSRAEVLATLREQEMGNPHRRCDPSFLVRLRCPQPGRAASDVDLVAAFDQHRRLSLLDIIHIQAKSPSSSAPPSISWKKEHSSPASRPPLIATWAWTSLPPPRMNKPFTP